MEICVFISKLFITGSPINCGDKDLPQVITCNSNEEISGNVTLCGKPRPTVSWIFGGKTFNGSVVQTNADQHQYMYSFKKEIDSGMCGKKISYQTTGFGNIKVTGSSLIIIKNCKYYFPCVWSKNFNIFLSTIISYFFNTKNL